MSSTYGKIFKISTFGESHGRAIGVVVDGCPAGIDFNEVFIQSELNRRKPGQSKITTQRKEADEFQVLSGVFEGKTTGTPIAMVIPNEDQRSKDYGHISNQFRPSHADYTYSAKSQKVYDIKKTKELLEAPRSVVDLHIEKLSNDWRHLSNYEIMTIQLKAFEKYYDLSLAHFQASFIVIHGVGSGKLRDEIHELLKQRSDVKTFVNQYDARFGYGATEIFFQY